MALTSIIKAKCPICGKPAVEKGHLVLGDERLIDLACGHMVSEASVKQADSDTIVSSDGRKLMPYQMVGVKFAEESGVRCLIADEQGLGKTIQALAVLKLHPELLPVLIVTKTSIKLQWHHEVIRWCGVNGYLCQTIQSGKERAMPGFNVYIATYDLIKVKGMFDMIQLSNPIKTLILDECQAIKNHLSERAKAVQKIGVKTEHIIGLSGTPIKNNAGEYFTILNLIQPRIFPDYSRYINYYCDHYDSGWGIKVGGLKRADEFHEVTKEFIIRRTKSEVLPDLPEMSRRFFHVELDKKLNSAYAKNLKELDDLMYDEEVSDFDRQTNMLAIISKLRQITGLSKVEAAVDFVTDFLLSNTDRKMVVFVHHHNVATNLEIALNQWLRDGGYEDCLSLHSGLDGNARQMMVEEFKNKSSRRVMIASTLASGEGLNLQFCSDAIMLERQWNPANEEQAEARFHRFGQTNAVTATYMICSETVDEYFTELVEQKRAIVASTLDNKEIQWDQNNLLSELANILVTKGREKWHL